MITVRISLVGAGTVQCGELKIAFAAIDEMNAARIGETNSVPGPHFGRVGCI
jgi:hypothetical protein